MHIGQYVFAQIASSLPKGYFECLVVKFDDILADIRQALDQL